MLLIVYFLFHPRLKYLLTALWCWTHGLGSMQGDLSPVFIHTILSLWFYNAQLLWTREHVGQYGLVDVDRMQICEILRPHCLHLEEVICVEIFFSQDSTYWLVPTAWTLFEGLLAAGFLALRRPPQTCWGLCSGWFLWRKYVLLIDMGKFYSISFNTLSSYKCILDRITQLLM